MSACGVSLSPSPFPPSLPLSLPPSLTPSLPPSLHPFVVTGYGPRRLMVSGSAPLPLSLFQQWKDISGQWLLQTHFEQPNSHLYYIVNLEWGPVSA